MLYAPLAFVTGFTVVIGFFALSKRSRSMPAMRAIVPASLTVPEIVPPRAGRVTRGKTQRTNSIGPTRCDEEETMAGTPRVASVINFGRVPSRQEKIISRTQGLGQ